MRYTKAAKSAFCRCLRSRTAPNRCQVKPSWARPGPWVFGASQSVKICCQCCNLFIYFSSFFCKLLLLLLSPLLLLLLLLQCLVEHKNVQPTRRRTHWTSATCAHCLFHTLIGPQALLCAPLPYSPCSTCCCCSPASTSTRTASTASAQPAIGLSCLVVRFPAKIGDAM